MLSLLGFFIKPTSFLAPLAALGLGLTLGFGGGFLKGHDVAVTKYRVAALQDEVAQWKKASDDLGKQLEEDQKIADAHEQEASVLRNRIREIVDAQAATPVRCKLDSRELQQLRAIARQAGSSYRQLPRHSIGHPQDIKA